MKSLPPWTDTPEGEEPLVSLGDLPHSSIVIFLWTGLQSAGICSVATNQTCPADIHGSQGGGKVESVWKL